MRLPLSSILPMFPWYPCVTSTYDGELSRPVTFIFISSSRWGRTIAPGHLLLLVTMLQTPGKYDFVMKYNLVSHQGPSESTNTQVIGTKSSNRETGCCLCTVAYLDHLRQGNFSKVCWPRFTHNVAQIVLKRYCKEKQWKHHEKQ